MNTKAFTFRSVFATLLWLAPVPALASPDAPSGTSEGALDVAPVASAPSAPSAPSARDVPSAAPPASAAPWKLNASYDLGMLGLLGVGVHAGVSRGPWTGALGFYRFESKNMFGGLIGGFGEEFGLHVDWIVAAQGGYYFNGKTDTGFYGKVIYQAKQQTVTHKASGAEAVLTSHLVGPEIGYEWDIVPGLFLRPRAGVLFYVKSPQPGRDPVAVGPVTYDNGTHTWIDAYVTADIGFEFSL